MPDDEFTAPAPGATADGRVIIHVVGLAGFISGPEAPPDPTGQYVETYDPEAFGGLGDVTTTTDPAKAARFPDTVTALHTWQIAPQNRPMRLDGRPNRPLSAFSIEVVTRTDVVTA